MTNELVSEVLDFELSKLPEGSLVKEVIMSEKRKVVSTIFHEYTQKEQEQLTKTKMEDAKEEGIQIGKNLGKEENSIEIARKMLESGEPVDKVARFTELPAEKLDILKKELDSEK